MHPPKVWAHGFLIVEFFLSKDGCACRVFQVVGLHTFHMKRGLSHVNYVLVKSFNRLMAASEKVPAALVLTWCTFTGTWHPQPALAVLAVSKLMSHSMVVELLMLMQFINTNYAV